MQLDPRVSTETVMSEIRQRVRADLRERLVARGAAEEFADQAVFDEVDALFRRALARDDPWGLLLPSLMADPSQLELSLRLTSHRRSMAGTLIVFAKKRLLLPLMRWLFEYAVENFRVQTRVNIALMSALQTLTAEHVRLRREVAALYGRGAERSAPQPAVSAERE